MDFELNVRLNEKRVIDESEEKAKEEEKTFVSVCVSEDVHWVVIVAHCETDLVIRGLT